VANLQAGLPKDVKRCLGLAARLLIKRPGTLVPKDVWAVINSAKNEAQRRKWLRAAAIANPDDKAFRVSPFMKREVYTSEGDPRNISDVTAEDAVNKGLYTAPLLVAFQYSCHVLIGLNSFEVGQRLMEMDKRPGFETGRKYTLEEIDSKAWVVFGDDGLVKIDGVWYATDFSRLDGTVSFDIRDGFVMVARRGFKEPDASHFVSLIKAEENVEVTTSTGVTYNTGSSVLSGSKITSLLGTFANVLVIVTAGTTGRTLSDAAGVFGLKLKIEPQDGTRVCILSRVYPDISQSAISHALVIRALKKIPITFKGQEPRDKVLGYLATESHVPVVGDYCAALVRINKWKPHTAKELESLWQRDRDMAWRLQDKWRGQLREDEQAMLLDSVARCLGVDVDDVRALRRRIASCRSLNQLGKCYLDFVGSTERSDEVDRE